MVKIGPLYGGSESVTWWFNITVKIGLLYGGSESVIWWFNIWCKSVHSMVGVSPQFGDLIWCCVSITNLYNGVYGVLILLPGVMTVLVITVFFYPYICGRFSGVFVVLFGVDPFVCFSLACLPWASPPDGNHTDAGTATGRDTVHR